MINMQTYKKYRTFTIVLEQIVGKEHQHGAYALAAK